MNPEPGGLGELPLALGPSDQQQQQLNQTWNTFHQIEAQLCQSNIMPMSVPIVGIPEMTVEVVRGLNDAQYMQVYIAHDAWNSYIGETISQVQNIILQIENELDDLSVHIEQNLKVAGKGDGK